MLEMTVVGIATLPRCHLDQRERSHAAIIRPKKGSLGNTRFFLASLRNDSGGGIMAFALPGTTRFLASARNDREKKRNDSGGVITAFALPGRSRWQRRRSRWQEIRSGSETEGSKSRRTARLPPELTLQRHLWTCVPHAV